MHTLQWCWLLLPWLPWPEHPDPKHHLRDEAHHTALRGWIKDLTSSHDSKSFERQQS